VITQQLRDNPNVISDSSFHRGTSAFVGLMTTAEVIERQGYTGSNTVNSPLPKIFSEGAAAGAGAPDTQDAAQTSCGEAGGVARSGEAAFRAALL
jgi:hypothetical protein